MCDMQHEISRLLHFARQKGLIAPEDEVYAANRLLDVLGVEEYVPEQVDETLETATPILERMLDYAAGKGLIEGTTDERDLFDTRIMDCVMPRPSEVVRQFRALYAASPREATDYYYDLSIASNYIRKARIDKNIAWQAATEYGALDVTINLSKPEKDPRDIAKAKLARSSAYPKCLLCRENEGYAGRVNHPARKTHRLIPLELAGRSWFLQYSPYTYYNEHCIVLNNEHVPMAISRETFENLAAFLEIFPHYFAGSNADLPIVGGSILSHDHYQGGRYTFAMERAAVEPEYRFANYPNIRNNRTTAQHPLGLFHQHADVHHIKKENIGLIEVLGLAILPARLKSEMEQVRAALLKGTEDISGIADIEKHADWYRSVRASHPAVTEADVDGILRDEIGAVFLQVLTHAGVFKRDAAGMAAFDRWIDRIKDV